MEQGALFSFHFYDFATLARNIHRLYYSWMTSKLRKLRKFQSADSLRAYGIVYHISFFMHLVRFALFLMRPLFPFCLSPLSFFSPTFPPSVCLLFRHFIWDIMDLVIQIAVTNYSKVGCPHFHLRQFMRQCVSDRLLRYTLDLINVCTYICMLSLLSACRLALISKNKRRSWRNTR